MGARQSRGGGEVMLLRRVGVWRREGGEEGGWGRGMCSFKRGLWDQQQQEEDSAPACAHACACYTIRTRAGGSSNARAAASQQHILTDAQHSRHSQELQPQYLNA